MSTLPTDHNNLIMKAQAREKFTNHPALDYLDLEILIVIYVSNNSCYLSQKI